MKITDRRTSTRPVCKWVYDPSKPLLEQHLNGFQLTAWLIWMLTDLLRLEYGEAAEVTLVGPRESPSIELNFLPELAFATKQLCHRIQGGGADIPTYTILCDGNAERFNRPSALPPRNAPPR
jgi:hypothetical protein